jgi:HK97 gp10 family phage protein
MGFGHDVTGRGSGRLRGSSGDSGDAVDTGCGVTITIEGAGEIAAKLKELPRKVEKQFSYNALHEAADIVENEIRGATPRKTGRTGSALTTVISTKKSGATARIFFDQEWPWTALFLENGTLNHFGIFGQRVTANKAHYNRKKRLFTAGSNTERMKATHFISNAFRASIQSALQAMIARLKVDIEMAAGENVTPSVPSFMGGGNSVL